MSNHVSPGVNQVAGAESPTGARQAALVQHFISAHAQRMPHRVAVASANSTLTWRQLESRSNQLARHLLSREIGKESPVALYFQRSPEFVIGALAIWKAGAAYLPLDAAYPPERIDAILQDAAPPVVLSHQRMAAGLRAGAWSVIDLDIDRARMDTYSVDPLEATVTNGDPLAYLIYTSGSTGRPKGVEVTHANLTHLIGWHGRAFNVTPEDRASQVSGLAFDAAVWEIWCHLASGASVHFADEDSRRSPYELRDWLVRERITVAFISTVMAEHLITLDWPPAASLRILLTGADTLHRYPRPGLPFTLVNNYGPTECTVLVTSGQISNEPSEGLPSIGRPIDGTEILILDEALQPVPPGEAGEICVAGSQVSRGYRNEPSLTAEKFVVRSNVPGGRIYRTGDRGRFLPSGEIAFLGRIDEQIKIRGFRVEPDDVVAQLVAHSEVVNAVVTASADTGDTKHLIAHLVLVPGSTLSAFALRQFLAQRLPEYMIPAHFVKLESIPLTANGKSDKASLPLPARENTLRDEFADAEQQSASETQRRISAFVSALMGGREVGRDENFFLIGGHSMLAAQLLAKVRENFGVSLTLRQLFETPTVATLAVSVEQRLSGR